MHQRKKLRLRDWLEDMIDAGLYGFLKWEGDPRMPTFRIPWKHGSRHGWLYLESGPHLQKKTKILESGRYKEIREESCPRGKDAYKIYKMRSVRGRGKGFGTQRCLAHC